MKTDALRRRMPRVPRAGRVGLAALALVAGFAGVAGAQEVPSTSDTHGMMEWEPELFVLSEVLEYAPDAAERPVRYDVIGWIGGAFNRLWLKADGEQGTRAGGGETEIQALYGRLVSPYWDAQAGLRVDVHYGEERTRTRAALALGFQGLAPGWFELEPTLFVSQDGDLSASLTASYDVLFTQRLVVQPRMETGVAVQAVPDFGVGSGFNEIELGLRARYEIRREFAPYVGVSWARRFGETAELARAAGERVRESSVVIGLRVWR